MFNNRIVIAGTSGHKIVKALRCYEHNSSAQQQAVTASVNVDANPSRSSDVPKTAKSGASPFWKLYYQHFSAASFMGQTVYMYSTIIFFL